MDVLRNRGWEVVDARRAGIDVDLEVVLHGTPGKVRFRNAFEPTPGVAASQPAPIFLRVDLGEPRDAPTRWAVWDRYIFPGGKEAPAYVATVIHEAIGDGWASVAGCSLAPNGPWYDHRDIATIFARAESLAPSQDEVSRHEQILANHRRNFSAQRERGRHLVGTIALLTGAAALWAMVVHVATRSASSAMAHGVALSVLGLPALVLSIVGVVMLVRHVLAPRKPLPGVQSVVDLLRSSGAFDAFKTTPRKCRDGLPVPARPEGYVQDGAAPLSVSRLSASSSTHGIKLDADLCELAWPDGVLAEAQFVPDRWLTVDLEGPEAELAKLPRGPREDRRPGVVRWTFTGDELDAGKAAECFHRAAATWSASANPYRWACVTAITAITQTGTTRHTQRRVSRRP